MGRETGRIGADMIKKYVQNIPEYIFYVVGSPAMVERAKAMLTEMNISEENIKGEQFTSYYFLCLRAAAITISNKFCLQKLVISYLI